MVRNLLSNALKYTKRGKVLLGCRRRHGVVRIEIWDTGIGIPESELRAIFEEYHQLDNEARERSQGLGLGLSIVKRLVKLLDHRIHVRSRLGKGSVFAIEITIPEAGVSPIPAVSLPHPAALNTSVTELHRKGALLIIEDDPDVREFLQMLLESEGHQVASALDGHAALEMVEQGKATPDLILADFNLPRGLDGLEVAARMRAKLKRNLPVIIMTGDISTKTMRDIDREQCVQLNKPVRPKEMMATIERLLSAKSATPAVPDHMLKEERQRTETTDTIYVVDDDKDVCESFRALLEDAGHHVETYVSCEAFLTGYNARRGGCLLVDGYLPGMNGLALLQQLRAGGDNLPAIMITGSSDVQMAVKAMKAGASDFIEKPIGGPELRAAVERALEQSRDERKAQAWRENATDQIAGLTARQRQIMEMVLAGHPSKNIAADLGISQRTVENHRAEIMRRTGSKSLPALARLALAANAKAPT